MYAHSYTHTHTYINIYMCVCVCRDLCVNVHNCVSIYVNV